MAAAKQIIKGKDLMLFDASGNSIAYATNHTLSISAEVGDVSSKDHGIWGASEITKMTWEITSENLYTKDEYDTLFTSMMSQTAIQVYFGGQSETTELIGSDGNYTGTATSYTKGNGCYKGMAFITSLTANAANGENATFSVTLTGSGKIEKSA